MKKFRKQISYAIVAFLFFFAFAFKTNAVSLNKEITSSSILARYDEGDGTNIVGNKNNGTTQNENVECSLLGETTNPQHPAYWLQMILNFMKYVAIVALLALVTMDFFKAIVGNDKDALKKASTTAVKRFIYCVLIFFLPIIVDFIMTMFGIYGGCTLG